MPPKRKKLSELSESAKYFRTHPEARAKKDAISKEINKRPEQRKKRVELQQKRREAIKKGIDTSKTDHDHAVGKRVSVKTNRGRMGEGNRVKKSK
jgi:hypothetical protein